MTPDAAPPRRLIADAVFALEFLCDRAASRYPDLFECDCEPSYEADTNAYNHRDDCAGFMEDHASITLDALREWLRP